MTFTSPSFVTFTGADDNTSIIEMVGLSARYPIEWGILIAPELSGQICFPSINKLEKIRRNGLRLSAHLCGKISNSVFEGGNPGISLSGFSRVQINRTDNNLEPDHILAVQLFGRKYGIRTILQCDGAFPDNPKSDWLFDTSYGTGKHPEYYPRIEVSNAFCGISGGISPSNVQSAVSQASGHLEDKIPYWIDIESGIRSDKELCINKCEQICRTLFEK